MTPLVAVLSLAGHAGVLLVLALVPLPERLDPIGTELAFDVHEPPPRAAQPPPPPIEEPAQVAAATPTEPPSTRPRPPRRAARPAPVLTAAGGALSHPPGEVGGQAGGAPGGSALASAPQAAPPAHGVSREALRAMLVRYVRDTLSRYLDGRIDYPLAARRAHLEGVVMLRVRLARDGRVLGVRLSRSCGHEVLDRAALASVQGLGSMPAPPHEIPWDEAQELPLPVTYVLQ